MDILSTKLGKQALIHKSYLNENKDFTESNERLEFLGDAVLELVSTDILYRNFPKKDEGFLTTLRSKFVNTKNLATLAKKLGIGEKIRLSKGEEASGGRSNESLLADTVEAIIGAIYLEKGHAGARDFITENILVDLEKRAEEPKDPKSSLQELVQAKGWVAPRYKVIKEVGPDHDKMFTVEAKSESNVLGTGTGKSKAEAEQMAASAALEFLKLKD